MDSDQLRRVMRDLGDAVNAYQQGQGFVGIEKLPSEIEQLCSASYVRHAQEIRNGLKRKDHGAILSELILVLERLERERDEEAGRLLAAQTPAGRETHRLDPLSLADLARLRE
jgi:hypothetical protein